MGLFFRKAASVRDIGVEPYKPCVSTIIGQIHRDIMTRDWDESYAPPEMAQFEGNLDTHTVLGGFRADAIRLIVERLKSKHAENRMSDMELGRELTRIAYEQTNRSTGPFVRSVALDARERHAPDFLKSCCGDDFAGLSAEDKFARKAAITGKEEVWQSPLREFLAVTPD